MSHRPKHLPGYSAEAVVTRYRAGESVEKLVKVFRFGQNTLYRILDDAGVDHSYAVRVKLNTNAARGKWNRAGSKGCRGKGDEDCTREHYRCGFCLNHYKYWMRRRRGSRTRGRFFYPRDKRFWGWSWERLHEHLSDLNLRRKEVKTNA